MEAVISLMKSLMPVLVIGVMAFVGYWVKLIMDKNANVKKASNGVWIQIIPKTGNEANFMVPKVVDNGVVTARIPTAGGKITSSSPICVLGEDGEYSALWPPGKNKFVQIPVSKLTYYEGDTEPLSNTSNRPIVSGQLIANLVDGVATSTADALRKSQEDSAGGVVKKSNPLFWAYIILGIIAALSVANLIFGIQGLSVGEKVIALSKLVQQALGLR
jgi:hypothetical protein